MFIPDLDIYFFRVPIPDPGVKKATDHGYGTATLVLALAGHYHIPTY
jgi:hypothetical protein